MVHFFAAMLVCRSAANIGFTIHVYSKTFLVLTTGIIYIVDSIYPPGGNIYIYTLRMVLSLSLSIYIRYPPEKSIRILGDVGGGGKTWPLSIYYILIYYNIYNPNPRDNPSKPCVLASHYSVQITMASGGFLCRSQANTEKSGT